MSQTAANARTKSAKFTTREIVFVGMFAAVLAVISQISLPMPTGVPITIQVFGVARCRGSAWGKAWNDGDGCVCSFRS